MKLYVTTRGRVDRQHTLKNLPTSWLSRTVIVCPVAEVAAHQQNWPKCGVWGVKTKNLAEKRALIFETTKAEKIMLLDDDLRFHVRHRLCAKLAGFGVKDNEVWNAFKAKYPDATKLHLATPDDPKLKRMFDRMEEALDKHRHGGISIRYMNQVNGSEFSMNMRALHALSFHVPTVLEHCKLNRIVVASDYDYTLQLLRAGFDNAIYNWGTNEEPAGFGAEGGCSIYRDADLINKCMYQLEKLHPRIFSVNHKKPLTDRGLLKVRIRWKQAIEEGRMRRLL